MGQDEIEYELEFLQTPNFSSGKNPRVHVQCLMIWEQSRAEALQSHADGDHTDGNEDRLPIAGGDDSIQRREGPVEGSGQ